MTPARGYDALRERIGAAFAALAGRLGERFAAYALAAPDLAVLYWRVVFDERVPRARRGELIAAALYVLSPIDVVPEALFGPIGLVDDAAVASRLFDVLLNGVPPEVVREHWPGDRATLARLRDLAARARRAFAGGRGLGAGVRRLFRRGAAEVVRRLGALGVSRGHRAVARRREPG
jgi:uncharacterized membrane protein YkvA (DUF1232 family)